MLVVTRTIDIGIEPLGMTASASTRSKASNGSDSSTKVKANVTAASARRRP
jgi:hypothetical protein